MKKKYVFMIKEVVLSGQSESPIKFEDVYEQTITCEEDIVKKVIMMVNSNYHELIR